jgi:lipopolysaccharide/colanic/teichoic acid biosynthesis glycosyltransferase
MMQMDLQYVSNRTLWLDLSILLETVPAVAGQVKNSWAAKRGHRKQREEHAI